MIFTQGKKQFIWIEPYHACPAYTLTEVIVALAVLTVIATVTMPKFFQNSGQEVRDATLKDTISALSLVLQEQVIEGQVTAIVFLDRLNCKVTCPTNSEEEGCWNTGIQGDAGWYTGETGESGIAVASMEYAQPGCILTNGVNIVGFDNDENPNGLYIDWNGNQRPNRIGEDQLYVNMCYGSEEDCEPPVGLMSEGSYREDVRFGKIGAVPLLWMTGREEEYQSNKDLFKTIYQ